jgi:hypothetical protein
VRVRKEDVILNVTKTMVMNELGVVVHTCNPSYWGGGGGRVMSLSQTWTKLVRAYFENKIKAERLRL